MRLMGHLFNSTLNFFEEVLNFFYSGCTILQAHWQCMRVPIFPYPCQTFFPTPFLFPFLPFFFPLSFPSSPKTLHCCHWSWVEQENLEATEPCCSYSQLRTWQKEGEARSAPNSSFLVTFAAVTLRGRHHRSSASKQSSSPSTPPGVLSGSCTDQRKIAASSPSPLQHFSSVGSEELACRSCILTSSPAKLELHSSSLLLR